MDTRSTQETAFPLAWPLAGSLLLTAFTVALVCERPTNMLHSWRQVFTLATLYLLIAGFVHALAVWGVCRVRDDSEPCPHIWPVIWAAWVAIVWLPLIALLSSERSPLVAVFLPVTAIFATILLKGRAAQEDAAVDDAAGVLTLSPAGPELFCAEEAPPLWRVLRPSILTGMAAQAGVVMLAAHHDWTAGCLLGAAAIYPVDRWLDGSRTGPVGSCGRSGVRSWRGISAGNSLFVWLMLVLALLPFLTMYAAGELRGMLGIPRPAVLHPIKRAHSGSSGYSSIILFTPRKPHEIVVPQPATVSSAPGKPRAISFDGAYWYFKQPDTRPGPNARVEQGDPTKKHVGSTDEEPLIMEAHQPLDRPIAMSCCRSLRVDLTNADNVPGTIALEVLLRDMASKKDTSISLGAMVLASSKVSPMPLHRAPVEDSVTFPLPRALAHGAGGRTFDEITVRIKPERSRSLAAARVSIKDFVLQP